MEKNDSGQQPSSRRPTGAPRADGPRGKQNEANSRAGRSGRPREVTQPTPVDLQREKAVPIKEVPKLGIIPVRRKGARLNLRTLYRWATVGLRGVVLPTQLVGGQRVTSVEALIRFFDAVTTASRSGTKETERGSRPALQPDVGAELDRHGL